MLRSLGVPILPNPPLLRGSASQALSGHRVVMATSAGFAYPDPAVTEHGDRIVGITTSATDAGAATFCQDKGLMTDPAWSWNVGPLFCGLAGVLTQSPPDGVWLRQVGEALAPTMIAVHLFPTYFLKGA